MATKLSTKIESELKTIQNAVRRFGAAGASIQEIKKSVSIAISQRTLQRRLGQLRMQSLVKSSGSGRNMHYYLREEKKDELVAPSRLPLTNESKNILPVILRPDMERTPVGYKRAFLERYQPNVTSYLTAQETKKLFELGSVAAHDPATGTYTRTILQRLLIDLSYSSSRLEGNTYSLLDTELLINLGEPADNKSTMETQMILNHKDAIEFIIQPDDEINLNRYTILNLHALLSNNLLSNPGAPGRLRTFRVGIGKSVYTPLSMPQLIEEEFQLMLEKARQIRNPFEQAFFIMVHLPYLQPFEDVNKRVSRLAANIPLNRHNLAPLSFIDVPKDRYIQGLLAVYELNRVELLKDVFLWAYERSASRYGSVRQSVGEPDIFRLKYRMPIRTLVTQIVSTPMDKKAAGKFVKNKSSDIPEQDREKFIEYVETELLHLHEGNFARFMVSPAEFKRWKETWG